MSISIYFSIFCHKKTNFITEFPSTSFRKFLGNFVYQIMSSCFYMIHFNFRDTETLRNKFWCDPEHTFGSVFEVDCKKDVRGST